MCAPMRKSYRAEPSEIELSARIRPTDKVTFKVWGGTLVLLWLMDGTPPFSFAVVVSAMRREPQSYHHACGHVAFEFLATRSAEATPDFFLRDAGSGMWDEILLKGARWQRDRQLVQSGGRGMSKAWHCNT